MNILHIQEKKNTSRNCFGVVRVCKEIITLESQCSNHIQERECIKQKHKGRVSLKKNQVLATVSDTSVKIIGL